MTNAFLNRCIAPRVLSRGSRARKFKQFLALLLFGAFAGSAAAKSVEPVPLVTTLTYNDGDLFLGFRSTDRTKDYLINIGQPDQFVNAPPGSTFQVAVGNTSADLVTAFGSDWYTRIDPNTGVNAVFWAVTGGRQIAASGDPANVLYSTNPISNPWPRHSDTAQSFTTSLIAAMGNAFAGNQPSPNNPNGLIQNATSNNSYASFQPDGVNSNGISFQTWNPSNEAGPANGVFFNRIAPGSGTSTVLGSFLLTSDGQLSFTATVLPTPTPSPTATATATATATPTATATATATPTATATIAPTPTPTPSSTPALLSISGNVDYCTNPALPPVPNVTMTITGASLGSTTTDGSGNYTFSSLSSGGSYTVTPTKTALTPGSAGINTLDVIAIQRHFLNLGTPLTGCKLTAADVNGVGGINTLDVIATQRFFLGQVTGTANVGKYQFNPVNRTYTGIVTNQTAQNYDTIVFGDVAGSSYVHRPEDPSQTMAGDDISASDVPSAVALPEVTVDQFKSTFVAPVTTTEIDAKNKLVGFQGDLTFNERVVTFQSEPVSNAGLTGGNWNVSGNVLPGAGPIRTLRISAYSNDFTPLSGSGTLFNLNVTRVSKTVQGTQLIWATPPDAFIFIDADLNTQKPDYAASGGVTSSETRK